MPPLIEQIQAASKSFEALGHAFGGLIHSGSSITVGGAGGSGSIVTGDVVYVAGGGGCGGSGGYGGSGGNGISYGDFGAGAGVVLHGREAVVPLPRPAPVYEDDPALKPRHRQISFDDAP